MKRSLVVVALLLLCAPLTFATLVTNMNQSALYFRLLSRNASTDVDAVFYNPAGTARMADGWHFSLSNQSIFQEKTVINDFPLLNMDTYEGKVTVPLFPDAYAVYKTGRLALSFGFGPNSGGGSADFAHGLPSFEIPFSELPVLLTLMGIPTDRYSVDIAFEGRSIYWGFQLNAAYTLADFIDVAAGARLIVAHNSYTGTIQDVMINPFLGGMVNAEQFFTLIGAPAYAALVSDKSVDAAQNGTAVTPLVSLNLHPVEGLNIGVKYEFVTKLHLTNDTTTDDLGLFPDGYEFESDIPAILSLGLEYRLQPRFMVTASFNYFFDKQAIWEDNRQDDIESNSWDLGAGLEYGLTDSIVLSAGFLHTQFNLLPAFNSDFSHEMSSNSIGLGGRVKLGSRLDLDLGALLTFYDRNVQTITIFPFGNFTQEYKRTNPAFAVGLNYHLVRE
jgi:long-chain fatty acid transport protein